MVISQFALAQALTRSFKYLDLMFRAAQATSFYSCLETHAKKSGPKVVKKWSNAHMAAMMKMMPKALAMGGTEKDSAVSIFRRLRSGQIMAELE